MKFIFPQNYNFKNKLLGIIDYSTAFFNLIIYGISFLILHLFLKNWSIKIFLLFSYYHNAKNFRHILNISEVFNKY